MTRILVVEDSPTQAEGLRLVLEAADFAVDVARNGRVALELLESIPFDLVLSDILMPETTGYDLCRHIKTNPRTRSTPVVLLTYLADPFDVLRGLECGADNFLTKPCEQQYLLHRIRAVLANRPTPGLPPSGTPLHFRGQGITITADKSQILDLLLAALEEFIRARQREQEAKAAGQAMAEAGRRKDQFLATLAHELRNPLAPLLTCLHILRRRSDSQSREQALDSAERQVRHLSRLVDDLLDASRVTVGRLRLQPQRLDLARLVRTAAEDRRVVLERSGLRLTIATPEVPVWVKGDDTRLSQVVHNLLDNAAKFTDGGGSVDVRVTLREGRGGCRRQGHGHRNRLGDAAAIVRRLRPGRSVARPLARRVGDGAGAGQGRGRAARRRGACFQRWPGPRRRVHLLAARRAGAGGVDRLEHFSGGSACKQETAARDGDRRQSRCGGQPVSSPEVVWLRCRGGLLWPGRGASGGRSTARGGDLGHRPAGVGRLRGGCRPACRDPATADALMIAVSGYGQEEDVRRARAAGFDHYLGEAGAARGPAGVAARREGRGSGSGSSGPTGITAD